MRLIKIWYSSKETKIVSWFFVPSQTLLLSTISVSGVHWLSAQSWDSSKFGMHRGKLRKRATCFNLELIMRFVCSKVCRFSCVIKGSWINRNDHSCTSRRGCGIIAGLGLFLERLGRLSFECNVVGRSLFCGLGLHQAIQLAVLRKLQWVVFSEPKGGEELHSWGQSIPLLPLTLR